MKGFWDHTFDDLNKDAAVSRWDYLRMVEEWKDPLPLPPLKKFGERLVYDDGAAAEYGTKMRAGDAFIKLILDELPFINGFAYVQTIGKAAPALAHLTKKYGKGMMMFCPASKQTTDDQRLAMENGASATFIRIAAMNNLRKLAAQWCMRQEYVNVPLGLGHATTTAAIVKTAVALKERDGEPEEVWTVMGSGVLSRALQIAWPNARFYGVPVSRNMKAGEVGRAKLKPYAQDFAKGLLKDDEQWLPADLDTIDTYDGKGYVQFAKMASKNAVFWNVAGATKPKTLTDSSLIESAPGWDTVIDYDSAGDCQNEYLKEDWVNNFA